MRTAPKDRSYILLAYPSFSDSGKVLVGHGRWVISPHNAQVNRFLENVRVSGNVLAGEPPIQEPHWEVAYVAEYHHGGRHYEGYSYAAKSVTITDPYGWMPCPTPPKSKIKG